MIILSLTIFAFCSWAVFSHKFDDGLVVKHLFIFAAISAFLNILDRYNSATVIAAASCCAMGLALWAIRHRHMIFQHLR